MSSRVQEQKLIEGLNAESEGDKLASKTLLRWKPDWEGAVLCYEKAATSFKNAKEYTRAKTAYKKCAVGFQNLQIAFSAAKNYEAAAMMAKESKDYQEAVEFYQKSSSFYYENNSYDKAAEVLVSAAKYDSFFVSTKNERIIEDKDPEKANELCNDAMNIFETEERDHFASTTFRYAINLAVKQANYERSLDLIKRYSVIVIKLKQQNDLNKLYLSAIIIHLKRNDFVAASRAYQDYMGDGFIGSFEAKAAAELLDAYEKNDPQALQTALGKQTFTFLDHNVIRLSKTLKISGEQTSSKEELKDDSTGLA